MRLVLIVPVTVAAFVALRPVAAVPTAVPTTVPAAAAAFLVPAVALAAVAAAVVLSAGGGCRLDSWSAGPPWGRT